MSKKYSTEDSQTDWDALSEMQDEEIDLSDIPEMTQEQMSRAEYRVGGKKVKKGKIRVTIYLDSDIVDYFKALAGGRGYQTLINDALKERMQTESLESAIRRVIREELGKYK